MSFDRAGLKVLALVFAVVYTAGGPAYSIADALFAAGGYQAQGSHVEDTTRDQCNPSHSGDCGLCQALASLAGALAKQPTPAPALGAGASGLAVEQFDGALALASVLPRAPPL
jgi:hypothetical protein